MPKKIAYTDEFIQDADCNNDPAIGWECAVAAFVVIVFILWQVWGHSPGG